MRTLAIGDIHGCYRSLAALEAHVKISSKDRLITLGDYVDRGPDSKSVIQWLIDRDADGNLIPLRGNHEVMMLAARESARDRDVWLACGGNAVLASYCTNDLDAIPDAHWQFLTSRLRAHWQTNTHFFVHANACADMLLDEQPDFMLYWEPFDDPAPHESGLTMVCGHTAQRSGVPLDVGHAICIDTWVYGRGWLTCLDVDARYCWQANESGDTRSFWLDVGP